MSSYTFASLCNFYSIDEIFKDIEIPESYDKETLVNTILDMTMTYEPIYIEMPFLNTVIKTFFKKHYNQLEKFDYLLSLKYGEDYNPLWNKDGSFKETQEYTKTNKNSYDIQTTDNNETVDLVAPFDSANWNNENKTTNDTNTQTNNNQDLQENYKYTNERTEQGNIGVTTTMTMINEEMTFHKQNYNNKYDIVALMFYDELFIHY